MTAPLSHDSAWYLANTLDERLRERRAAPQDLPREPDPTNRRAATRLQRWRTQLPFREADYFERRLAGDQLTEAELLLHLGESAETVAGYSQPPAWVAAVEAVYAGLDRWEPVALPGTWPEADNIGLLNAIAPLLAHARQRVQAGVSALAERYPQTPFDPATVEPLLLAGLPGVLRRMLSRTMVLELNVARLRGLLTGDTPEARYASFVDRLCQAETTLAILREYPVLTRQIVLCLDHWVNFSLEFAGHLCADWPEVRELLPSAEPGLLVDIDGNAGDTHRNGRAVLIAHFASGDRVVYKPKSLAVDAHFQTLLTWVNEHAPELPALPIHRMVARDGYGWVEFVNAHGCETADQVRRFYQRQGGYLALFYALEATDFHSENLIAAGEHPLMLDLEALFHARLEQYEPTRAQDLGVQTMHHSVLRVGMLPRRIWSDDEATGMDISGLGSIGGQLSPYHLPMLEGVGTDSMHLVRKRIQTEADRNRPTLNGEDVTLSDYTEDIVHGFETVYRLIQAQRESLLAPGGLVEVFSNDVVRVIVRETRTYGMLLTESFHPDVLRDALDRDRLMDRVWVGISGSPHLGRVIPHERQDLLRGDIPMFTTRARSRDLWTSTGEHIPDFFTTSGMELCEQRIRSMSEADRVRQVWIIRAALATTVKAEPLNEPLTAHREDRSATGTVRREDCLAQAVAIGDRLAALAVRGERGAAWLGLNLVGHRYWSLGLLDSDLYNGLPGLAFFLAHLGQVTGESRFTDLAQAATTTLQQNSPVDEIVGGIGGFEGWGGVVYTLAHLGTLWDRSALLAGARLIATNLPPLIAEDKALDILTGTAGCLAGLLALHRVTPGEAILASAVRCGDHLLAQLSAGFTSPRPGYAQGLSGIACVLLELTTRTGDTRYAEAAWTALARESEATPGVTVAEGALPSVPCWAVGAASLAHARLQALKYRDDVRLRTQIEADLRATLAHGFGHNHTLALGDLGNIELFTQAGAILGSPFWTAEADRQTARMLADMAENGWRCAAPQRVETPSLMVGLAGIGLGLLRRAEPARVPSVLALEAPVR